MIYLIEKGEFIALSAVRIIRVFNLNSEHSPVFIINDSCGRSAVDIPGECMPVR